MATSNSGSCDRFDHNIDYCRDKKSEGSENRAKILERYGRQMILPDVGVKGQENIMQCKVLLVGAGGIGSTVAMYLAAAGVTLTIVDHDLVEESNLHRQIIHDTTCKGINKSVSAVNRLSVLNPTVQQTSVSEPLTYLNAIPFIATHDIVIDATDNLEARYLINDACVLTKTRLVSGSAVGLEGQCTVFLPFITPCYRCLYPQPSIQEACRNCANAGVLGPVPGMIGCLLATEALKLMLTFKEDADIEKDRSALEKDINLIKPIAGKQIFYDARVGDVFSFSLPPRRVNCAVCGEHPTILSISDSEAFLKNFRQAVSDASREYVGELGDQHIVTVQQYAKLIEENSLQPHLLIDVRPSAMFSMTNLTNRSMTVFKDIQDCQARLATSLDHQNPSNIHSIAINIPINHFAGEDTNIYDSLRFITNNLSKNISDLSQPNIYVLCRRGIDSVVATRKLLEQGFGPNIYSIKNGLEAWKAQIDPSFPMY